MRLNRVLVLRREQRTNNSYRMLRFESFVFTCLTYRNVRRFRNGPVHKFYGLKASQMSKFRASSHEHPHVAKSRIFGNISKVRWPTTVMAKELTSRQKEKLQGKKNNLMAKRKTSWQKEKPHGKKKTTHGKKKLILILVFVFFVFNTARIDPYCNTKPKSLFLECCYSFGFGAPSIWNCAPKVFNSAPKLSAVRLKIYTWSHKCSRSQK